MAKTKPWFFTKKRDLCKVLNLGVGDEAVVRGALWFRISGSEFKVSPHGKSGDYDTGAWFVDYNDVREDLKAHSGDCPKLPTLVPRKLGR